MQVAGASCFVCAKVVDTVNEGVGCRADRLVAHQDCAPTGECPLCGSAFEPGRALESALGAPGAGSKLDGIRGWLLLFAIQLSFAAVFALVSGVVVLLQSSTSAGVFGGAVSAVLGAYGGYCVRLLWEKDPTAPIHAQWLLALGALLPLAAGAVAGNVAGAGRGLIWWAIWGPYLWRSKRVAAVYRRND